MVALPDVFADRNTWGYKLNAFLRVGHNEDGTLKLASSSLTLGGGLHVSGALSAPASGAGIELSGGTSPSQTFYNRSTSAYLAAIFNALSMDFQISGGSSLAIAASGAISFTKSLNFSVSGVAPLVGPAIYNSGGTHATYVGGPTATDWLNNALSDTLMRLANDGTLLLGHGVSAGSSANDFIIKSAARVRAVDAAGTGTIPLIGRESGGNDVQIGNSSTAIAIGAPATLSGSSGGNMVFANNRGMQTANAAGSTVLDTLRIDASNIMHLGDGVSEIDISVASLVLASGFLSMFQRSKPVVPQSNGFTIYGVAGGGGKTRLMILFADGSQSTIAIQA